MACGSKKSTVAWMVVFFVASLTAKGYGWNLPDSYYQGAGAGGGGNGGGYFGGRSQSTLNNQGVAGANAGSWNAGGVGNGGSGFPSQGQSGTGASGGVDRAANFGGSQWGGGDRRDFGGGVSPGGVSAAGDNLGSGGTGFQQGGPGGVGGSGSGASSGAGSGRGFGYNGQGPNFGQGQFTPANGNGLAGAGANGFGGSFGSPSSGFGPGGQYNGNRYPTGYAGGPPSQPWQYGPAASGGYGAPRWPWNGVGYVYRVPVAHVNPDGSYSFSYYTPYSSREETGHSNGNVEGTYGFQNDGAKHNFSFNAAPDVDLRSSIGGVRPDGLNPEEYGPQSVHSRGRLPLVPGTTSNGPVDEQTRTPDGLPVSVDRSQGPYSWTRSGTDGERSNGGQNTEAGNDDNALAVVGLPKGSTQANDASQPTPRDQVVRGSTEPGVSRNGNGANELDGRTGFDGTPTTARPLGGSVEQVMARPVNDVPSYANEIDRNGVQYNGGVPVDRSYQFGYQTPDATREESADPAGNVRSSFAYNNEAGRNDLQYVAGAGMGFRPTGGSLSVPNGLSGAGGPTGSRANDGDLSNGQRFGTGGVFGDDGSSLGSGGLGGGSNARFGGDRSSLGAGSQPGAIGSGTGVGSDGRPLTFGNQGTQLGDGVGRGSSGNGFGTNGRPLGAGTQFGGGTGSDTGFGSNGRPFGSQPGGGFGAGSGIGFGADGRAFGSQPGGGFGTGSGPGFGADGRPFGSQGTQTNPGTRAGASFGADGRPLDFGSQGRPTGGAFENGAGSGFGNGDGRSTGFGNQGVQTGAGTGSGFASGADGRRFGFGNQGTQFGAGGTGGRSFGFDNQGGQGFSTAGNQATTRNPVTRSPAVDSFNGSSPRGLSPVDGDVEQESTTINEDDSEQTTTFGGYGDVSGTGGLVTNANRRLLQ